jgi:hypothetical protein
MTCQGIDLSRAVWQKSSRSGGNGGQCVEVARNLPGIVAVRDSKHRAGPVLIFTAREWGSFISVVQAGRSGR